MVGEPQGRIQVFFHAGGANIHLSKKKKLSPSAPPPMNLQKKSVLTYGLIYSKTTLFSMYFDELHKSVFRLFWLNIAPSPWLRPWKTINGKLLHRSCRQQLAGCTIDRSMVREHEEKYLLVAAVLPFSSWFYRFYVMKNIHPWFSYNFLILL